MKITSTIDHEDLIYLSQFLNEWSTTEDDEAYNNL